jgi:Cys-tRNA(Pro)/Cys-tRNA(Cys) deacylase
VTVLRPISLPKRQVVFEQVQNRRIITVTSKDKTNAMRALEAHKIAYEVFTFSPDIHSADGVAEALGLPYQQVYKTLVVLRSPDSKGKPMLVLVAGDRELDLKRVASAVGEKKVRMASYKEAEALTGLQVGGISALALLNRPFDVLVDQPVTALSHVLVSAGKRGINLRVPAADLIRITRARVIQATQPAGEDS